MALKFLFEFNYLLFIGGWIIHFVGDGLATNICYLPFNAVLTPAIVKLLCKLIDFFLHRGVPVVFNSVVRSTLKHHRDLSPLVALLAMSKEKNPLFLAAPYALFYSGVQVIMPALTALLANATWQVFSDLGPLLWALLLHEY